MTLPAAPKRKGLFLVVIIPCDITGLNIAGVPSHKVKLALRDRFSNYQEKICPKAFKNET